MKIFALLILFFKLQAQAAPYPGMGSAQFADSRKGLFSLHQNFTISTTGTLWNFASTQESGYRFQAPQGQASLSIKKDSLNPQVNMKTYTKKWMRDYAGYGFEILAAKNMRLNNNEALVIDLISHSKEQQVRQVISRNKNEIAIMTCVDNKASFQESVKNCNKIIQNFKWIGVE